MKSNLPARRLIPKWRPISATLQTPDAVPIPVARPQPLVGDREDFERAVELWREAGALNAAIDNLRSGIACLDKAMTLAAGEDARQRIAAERAQLTGRLN